MEKIVCINNCMPKESIYSSKGKGKCKNCGRKNVELGKAIVKPKHGRKTYK